MVMQQNSQNIRELLREQLRLAENVWLQMLGGQWNQSTSNRLANLFNEMAHLARDHGWRDISALAAQFEQHLRVAQGARSITREQGQLIALLNRLRSRLSQDDEEQKQGLTEQAVEAVAANEILLVMAQPDSALLSKLQNAGFQVRYIDDLDIAEKAMRKGAPLALIITVDFADTPWAGVERITELRQAGGLSVPIFFISEKNDIQHRLRAVQAGGDAFFCRPYDDTVLIRKLQNKLIQSSKISNDRVMLILSDVAEAEHMSAAINAQSLTARAVMRPLEALHVLEEFKPDLLVLDAEMDKPSGLELYKILRQHRVGERLPIVLLSSSKSLNRLLAQLDSEGDSFLLAKPIDSEYLSGFVRQRLRHLNSVRMQLNTLSRRDPVTGLYNRRYFLSQLEHLIEAKGKSSLSIMLVILENMRSVRDKLNAAEADELIAWVGRRLQKALGSQRQPARFGDIVFAVLLNETDKIALFSQARQVRKTIESGVYQIGDLVLKVKICIGISTMIGARVDALSLIHRADLSCTMARESAAEKIVIYDTQLNRTTGASAQKRLLQEIQESIGRGRIRLAFQPIVSLTGGEKRRYEVLARMTDRAGSELVPETVFMMVHQDRLGVLIDRWIITRCIRLLSQNQNQIPGLVLFVNLTAATLLDKSFTSWLQEAFAKMSIEPQNLVFELLYATVVEHPERVRVFAGRVGQLGCGISLQRFPNNSEEWRLLNDLKCDYVKPRINLSHEIANNISKQNELNELVGRLKTLGITPIITGVEDLQTLPVLWSCGINLVQGYFLQRPHEAMDYDFENHVF